MKYVISALISGPQTYVVDPHKKLRIKIQSFWAFSACPFWMSKNGRVPVPFLSTYSAVRYRYLVPGTGTVLYVGTQKILI